MEPEKKPVGRKVYGAVVCLLLAIHVTAWSQNRPLERGGLLFRQGTIREASEEEAGFRDERSAAQEGHGDRTPLGVDIAAIHLISDEERVSMDPAVGSKKLVIEEGMPAPEGLEEMLRGYLGESLSMGLLSDINRGIVLAWRESDYPLVDVYVPQQNVTGGKLQIVVKEALLGQRIVSGAERSREGYVSEQLRLEPGDRINQGIVDEDLDWLNLNPVRDVSVIYGRGESDGTTDITLDVTEENMVTGYSGFGNTGVDFTGEEEWAFGVQLLNPFQTEQNLGYNFVTDLEWENLAAHTLVYQAYLPWRHTVRVLGAYVLSSSENVIPTNSEGLSRQLSFEYEIPLPRPDWNRNWRHHMRFGFDYKSTDTDLLFGGASFFNTLVEVGQYRGEYGFSAADESGFTQGLVGVVGSPGDMFRNNDDANFGLARAGSTADYWYGFAELERLQNLPGDFSLRFKMHAQATTYRLNATEQFLAGGYRTVRGYDESVIRGDSGVLTNLELISPEFALSPLISRSCEDQWNAFVFYDAAALLIEQKVPGEVSPSLQSVGLGLHCRIGDRGFARASYGWGIQNHGLLPTDNDDGKFHFGIVLTY